MMLSGVGTIGVYNYNTRTGILSSKDGIDKEFIELFNDELCADETETMNGYDQRVKAGLKNILDIWQQFADAGKLMALTENSEIEISYEITDSVTTVYTINGQKFTNIAAMYYLPEEISEFSKFPEMLQKGYGKTTSNPEGIPDSIYQKALARYEASMETAIYPIHVSSFREVSMEHYSFVPEPDIGKGDLRILINGESAAVFSVDDLKIRTDEKTGTRVMISEIVGGAWYDAIPVTDELERGLKEAMGVESIPEEELTGYYIGTHAGTGIQYVMRPGDEGRGGKVLLQNQADVAKYNALAEEYYTKYPNLVSCPEFGRIYASFEICGMMERTPTGIVRIGYDNISYNDNFDSKKNWSIMISETTWELLEEWLRENRSSMKEVQELWTWTEILDSVGGKYERIWSKGYCSQGKVTPDEFTIFHTDENLQYQRKLQKKREERELKERRERKERVEEALEAYAKYRRDLRHYYNELGYQKKMAASSGEGACLGSVKRPPVVSAAYELIMLLGM